MLFWRWDHIILQIGLKKKERLKKKLRDSGYVRVRRKGEEETPVGASIARGRVLGIWERRAFLQFHKTQRHFFCFDLEKCLSRVQWKFWNSGNFCIPSFLQLKSELIYLSFTVPDKTLIPASSYQAILSKLRRNSGKFCGLAISSGIFPIEI
jgi:hypothetical protein